MHRVTITIDDELITEIDRIIVERGYQNRSEAIRDLARAGLQVDRKDHEPADRNCVASLVYVYDHGSRELTKRLTRAFHDNHHLSLSAMHVHIDHDSCLEVAVLKGRTDEVRHFADQVIAERGVRHGRLVVVPADRIEASHPHGHGEHDHDHRHEHLRPREG
jgi:CopG family nickel-responsive transcriptional regulator